MSPIPPLFLIKYWKMQHCTVPPNYCYCTSQQCISRSKFELYDEKCCNRYWSTVPNVCFPLATSKSYHIPCAVLISHLTML